MKFQKFIKTIKSSLKAENHDFTQGDISEAVILLAIPMILEIGLESVFAIVDMFFVSGLGANAIATVGLTESVITIIYSIAIGLSTGATAIVARRTGEKNFEAAAHAGAQAIVVSSVLAIMIGGIGMFYAGEILSLMGASTEVVRDGTVFTRIMLGGSLAIVLLFLINGIFRGVGDAGMAMRSLWLASGVNIILCPILIHFFGLKGAAFATLIGRSSGVIYQLFHLSRGNSYLKMNLKQFMPDYTVIKHLITIAWPASFQFIIGSGSWIVLNKLIAETGGTNASAGYQIAFRNFVFFILPAWGLSNAAATLMGQNLGAKQISRAQQSVIITAKYSAIFMSIVTLILLLASSHLIGFFTSDPAVLEYGVQGLRILASGFVFYGVAMVLGQALNGAGDTKTPTKINFICFWIFQIPLAYFLVLKTQMGVAGASISIPLAHGLMTLITWMYFQKGSWKSVQV